MNKATFYIVNLDSPQATKKGFDDYALFMSKHFAKQGAKVYLHCHNKEHAEHIAELFWQSEPEDFMAHNLVGEGPKYATNIEIGYPNVKHTWNRQIVINLADNNTTFAKQFSEVVDFVPCEENAKQQARERYKIYRQAGFNLQTIEIQHP
ncbi:MULTISPECIES: DNA polymerase III subunit chi [Vibrio]|uniref:DNA polymerase III subunit chi n=2 Tax=Vibrio genomosp. F10 TaxID=723171 RepID=A0A1B9R121_9VIBR|nr:MULTISPECIES: DNA polymerase III subunit chi [Vibrio]OCH77997.1 DNA polymerase III subunit chi [Vibrio genomosp. F10]OEE32069.1 DNA polymerase III subunit chi [Vibrio genomosp. F10 str. ZF-129]OEE92872.1 DNA polymerase III subunit chi [Vibrio genomosp. F10 str. 9ZC157]OEF06408.1 DNA polymerase III subunit chi [Vibrio genomosp. F10 str. 9ZB36]OEF07892.1 DNA polymerase III subunit chi [Vibrio genomosp. F10 str. 9ZD137]